jgi:uncharacterized damage-inducible protein DinB
MADRWTRPAGGTMTPEQAKAAADAMARNWEREFPATAAVIGSVKNDNRDYRPDAKSRSAWDVAKHLATADIWFLDCIINGKFAFDPEGAKRAESALTSVDDVVAFYKKTFPEKLQALRALSGEQLAANLDFMGVMQMPRADFVGFATNHSIHHRGQLAAYLRAMGSKVPNIYGPSADAEP